MEYLKEIEPYIDINARIDLKTISLEYVRGMSGNREGLTLLIEAEEILKKLISLTKDTSDVIKKEAILTLINLSAEEKGSLIIMKLEMELLQSKSEITFIYHLLNLILDPQCKLADPACMLLCNLTRSPENLERCIEEISPKLADLIDAFTNVHYNTVECHLNYLGPLLSNLSCDNTVQRWLCDSKTDNIVAIVRIASFCHYKESVLRRGGAAGVLRNICFDVSRHTWLLESEVDILPYLLVPLAGGEEYADDEMDALPPSLQYLPPETQREMDPDIRILLLEALNRLCAKRPGREFLRKNGVYFILRELHKWEKDRKALLACENVVDILIRKEEEIENEDIRNVRVPEEYKEKFQQQDEEFINSNI